MSSMNITQLPDEILIHVLITLADIKDIGSCGAVCKNWRLLILDEPILWKTLCMRKRCMLEAKPQHHPFPWRWLYVAFTRWFAPGVVRNGPGSGLLPGDNPSSIITYRGDWRGGKRHGWGLAICERHPLSDPSVKGFQYVGYWVEDKRHGYGEQVWDDKSKYIGNWYQGKRHGFGKYYWPDGDEYEGEWVMDLQQGRGQYTWNNGDKYIGEWVGNARNGSGVLQFKEACKDRYSGRWQSDTQHGIGRYEWDDGRVYDGHWHFHSREGNGAFKFPDGSIYSGAWYHGLRHGTGTMIWADGTKYSGWWDGDAIPPAMAPPEDIWLRFFTKDKAEQRNYVRVMSIRWKNPEEKK